MDAAMKNWMQEYLCAVRTAFGARVVCVGLQGSRSRGEATDKSDIDAVLVLDTMTPDDLRDYRTCVAALPHRALLCGFVCGLPELRRWERSDLCSLVLDTEIVYGSFDALAFRVEAEDLRRSVLTGACGLYHACCHNFLHAQSAQAQAAMNKRAFFVLRDEHLLVSGELCRCRAALQSLLSAHELAVLCPSADWEQAARDMLKWASALIRQYGDGVTD